jgi:hypothetical protein
MIRILLFLIFLTQTTWISACLHADQNRIFPIGKSAKGWHVLELQKARFDEDFKPIWSATAFHNIYNEKHELLTSDSIGFYTFPENDHQKIYQFFLNEAIQLAKQEKSLIHVKPKSLYFCDFTRDNPEAKLSFDSINNKVFVQLISGNNHEINVIDGFKSFSDELFDMFRNDESKNELAMRLLCSKSLVSSVRKFTIGNKQLTIIHLAIGEFLSNADGNIPEPQPYFPKLPFNSLLNSLFFEPVLHHGYGFDFMIWE